MQDRKQKDNLTFIARIFVNLLNVEKKPKLIIFFT